MFGQPTLTMQTNKPVNILSHFFKQSTSGDRVLCFYRSDHEVLRTFNASCRILCTDVMCSSSVCLPRAGVCTARRPSGSIDRLNARQHAPPGAQLNNGCSLLSNNTIGRLTSSPAQAERHRHHCRRQTCLRLLVLEQQQAHLAHLQWRHCRRQQARRHLLQEPPPRE